MKRDAGASIENAIQAEDWVKARRLIERAMLREPDDHWLLSQLALTYYEQHDYLTALRFDLEALQIAPYCPLVVWSYAGTLDMLGQDKKSLLIYRWMASWGEDYIAHGECGEGLRAARSMIADCHYRIAAILRHQGQRKRALKALDEYISMRHRGVRSIYSLREAKTWYKEIQLSIAKRKSKT